jgi:hypothetical protein
MSGNHFNRDLGVELLEIHNYHDDFPYLPLFDITGTISIDFLQKTIIHTYKTFTIFLGPSWL